MYDLIIIWTWSAWLPAWMYASRYKIKNLIIGAMPGWALATSHKVENYPWIISSSGWEIMSNFKKHAEVSWSEILQETVIELDKKDRFFYVKTSSWKEFKSKFVIFATWNNYKKLWFKNENEFLGKWVSYCATCDGMFFKNMNVIIVWGWNTALTEALYLSEICKKVYLVHRKDTFRAEDIWVEQVKSKENIELILNEEVEEVNWDFFMEKAILKSWKVLNADWILEKDKEWCLVVDKRQETSLKWLYAAWDVTTNSNKFRQTIMSAAEGCLSANSIHEDLLKL
jgi:thioredoxin reductase (NADPH)